MEGYVDESGAFSCGGPFVAGIWFTAHPDLWRGIIRERRDAERYGYSFHFSEISRHRNDWQFRVVRRLFHDLRRIQKSWYARLIHVPPACIAEWQTQSVQEKYDTIIGEMIYRFGPHAMTEKLRLVISDRSRSMSDNFLPEGIEEGLNQDSTCSTAFNVQIMSHKLDDLLQIADLMTSAVRQIYHPGDNPNKIALAEMIRPLLDRRISVWHWSGPTRKRK